MQVSRNILEMINAFRMRTGMSETTFGAAAAGDNHLIRRLREKDSMTIKRLQKVIDFIRDNDPGDVQMSEHALNRLLTIADCVTETDKKNAARS